MYLAGLVVLGGQNHSITLSKLWLKHFLGRDCVCLSLSLWGQNSVVACTTLSKLRVKHLPEILCVLGSVIGAMGSNHGHNTMLSIPIDTYILPLICCTYLAVSYRAVAVVLGGQLLVIASRYPSLLQWNLSIKDTLGPGNLSTVERLSTLQR